MKMSRRAKIEKNLLSSVKCEGFFTVFIDYNGVVHHEFLPQGRTVNKECYLKVMRRLHEAIR